MYKQTLSAIRQKKNAQTVKDGHICIKKKKTKQKPEFSFIYKITLL